MPSGRGGGRVDPAPPGRHGRLPLSLRRRPVPWEHQRPTWRDARPGRSRGRGNRRGPIRRATGASGGLRGDRPLAGTVAGREVVMWRRAVAHQGAARHGTVPQRRPDVPHRPGPATAGASPPGCLGRSRLPSADVCHGPPGQPPDRASHGPELPSQGPFGSGQRRVGGKPFGVAGGRPFVRRAQRYGHPDGSCGGEAAHHQAGPAPDPGARAPTTASAFSTHRRQLPR